MPDFVPFAKQTSYPNLRPADTAIWGRFLAAYPLAYDAVAYNVHVGEVPGFVAAGAGDIGGDIHKIYKWKIDVLARKGAALDIIEVKPGAAAAGLGQLLSYDVLFEDLYNDDPAPGLVLLTDSIQSNMPRLCARHGVRLLVV